ncbi:MAG: alpha-E domain-containing protein, partial [Acidimicrobiales bacterium]
MLSRLAELLFWTGRYVERADDTSRIVDAYMHRLAEDPSGDATESRRALFTIMGLAPGDAPVDQGLVLDRLVYDRDDPSAITGALLAAVDNARRVREVISSEMWVCLNTTHTQLAPQRARARRVGVSSYLQFVRERAALFSGLTDATISRDETWWFLVLGQSVERIDMTARLLESRLRSARHAPDWLTLLRAAGAMESFLRATTAGTEPAAVAAFLLLDRAFPRSAYHALARADHCLGALSLADGRAGEVNQARGTIRRAQVRLEYSDPRSVLEELAELLD